MIDSNIQNQTKILVILGPTATGKTDLALYLAEKLNGEIVSCDSRQVYKRLDIGTGKIPAIESRIKNYESSIRKERSWWEIDGIRVWMYDVVSPKIQYTVADYVKHAFGVVKEVRERGKLPIVVGGTGLYLKALLYGLSNLSVPVDRNLRKELEQLTVTQLQERLKKISLVKWEKMNYSDQQNPRRLVRVIELEVGKGGESGLVDKGLAKEFKILKIGLTASKEILYQRSDERVVSRIKQGMIEEAEKLNKVGLSLKRMRQLGLEYGVLADYLENKTLDIWGNQGLIQIMQNKIHRFIRHQLTWFKKERNINWFNVTTSDYQDKIEKIVSDWYNQN